MLLAVLMPVHLIVQAEEAPAARLLGLNIGKADCMLLLWQDRAYLIDAGYSHTYPALKTALEQFQIDHLDGVFLTHCHKDHSGGMMPLAQSDIRVDRWYAPAFWLDAGNDGHPMALAAAYRGEETVWLSAGDVIDCGGGASLTVLGPLSRNEENENNNSLVMRFSSPAGSILFAGDMKEEEEDALLSAGLITACDLLKAGHHGDGNTASAAFLDQLKPRAALIFTSTPEETDTPSPSLIRRLLKRQCAVFVTQEYSDAVLLTLKNGEIRAEDVQWTDVPSRKTDLRLAIDLTDDALTIENTSGEALSLSGCILYSSKGDETLTLPELTLSPDQTLRIGSRGTNAESDIIWNEKRVWSRKKRDVAILYDAWGRPIACTDNGLEE